MSADPHNGQDGRSLSRRAPRLLSCNVLCKSVGLSVRQGGQALTARLEARAVPATAGVRE
jgi:hypothetical protein